MNYIDRYGIERVKYNLKYGKRYFKTYSDYANGGVEAFNDNLFLQDIGLPNFPIVRFDNNGWDLPKPPTEEEFESIYRYLTRKQ